MAGIDDKYIKVQGWMATQLGLHGNELIVYAYIYSFQFKNFIGKDTSANVEETEIPLRDFVEWTKQSVRNVMRIIQKLEDKGYIRVISASGKTNSYTINKGIACSAMKGTFKTSDTRDKMSGVVGNVTRDKMSGVVGNVTRDKMSGVVGNVTRDKMSPVPLTKCHHTPDKMSPVPLTKCHHTPDKMSPHLQHNYKDNKETTSTTPRVARDDASASLSSTDTEDRYEDLSKSEIAFFEKQALKKLNETDETTGQKLYLTKDPRDQFPKAFLFMTAKDTSQFTDTEFELFKMVSMYTAFGPAKPLPTVSEEDAKYVPPASEIGQEAHDAQQALVDWLFEGGPSPSSYAHDAPLQSRRQK